MKRSRSPSTLDDELLDAVKEGKLRDVKALVQEGAHLFTIKKGYGLCSNLLHVAAEHGHISVLRFLVNKGLNINEQDQKEGFTPLHYASKMGHTKVVQYLINKKADVHVGVPCVDLRPIHIAAEHGQIEVIKILLKAGRSVDEAGWHGCTTLHAAAREGQTEVVQFLIDKKADLRADGRHEGTPLHSAVRGNHKHIVEIFLKSGAKVNEPDRNGWTPLHLASEMGYLDMVHFLIAKGAKIHVRCYYLQTPLHLAAKDGNKEIVEFFLNMGLYIDAPDRENRTPLHLAAQMGELKVVQFLVEKKADIHAKTVCGQKPIHFASDNWDTGVFEYFLNLGMNVDETDKYGQTPLHLVSYKDRDHLKVVKFLIKKKNSDVPSEMAKSLADLDVQDENGKTPLHLAIERRLGRTAELLLEAGAKPDIKDKDGRTMLFYYLTGYHLIYDRYGRHCLEHNRNDGENILSRIGDFVNIDDKEKKTAAHIAFERGSSIAKLKYILQHQKDLNVKDIHGKTPLNCLTERLNEVLLEDGEREEAIRLYVENGAYFNEEDCQRIIVNPSLDLFTYVKLCTQSIVNMFENGDMSLPNGKWEINLVQMQIIRKEVYTSIEKEGVCDVFKVAQALLTTLQTITIGQMTRRLTVRYDRELFFSYAIKKGQIDVVKALIKEGVDIHSRRKDYSNMYSRIVDICSQRHDKKVMEFLLYEGRHIVCARNTNDGLISALMRGELKFAQFFTDYDGPVLHDCELDLPCSPVHTAAEYGHKEIVQAFLNAGNEVDVRTEDMTTPLHLASIKGHETVVQFLVDEKANLHATSVLYGKPIHAATEGGHKKLVEFFLSKDTDINERDCAGCTPLHVASKAGHLDIVQFLIDKGADISAKSVEGQTAMHLAAKRGHKDIVDIFLNLGMNINLADHDGLTPLHLASQMGKLKVVHRLVEKRADIHAKSVGGQKPMHASSEYGRVNVFKFFLSLGMNIEETDSNGQTVLHLASKRDQLKFLEFLIDKNPHVPSLFNEMTSRLNFDARDSSGRTPLRLAFEERCRRTVIYLLIAGARCDTKDNSGRTDLFYYLSAEHLKFDRWGRNVQYTYGQHLKNYEDRILEKITNFFDNEKNTAAHIAIKQGCSIANLKFILKHQKDLNSKNICGNTALNLLTEYLDSVFSDDGECEEAIWLFIENGAYFNERDCHRIMENTLFLGSLFTDAKLCTQSIVNTFRNGDLPLAFEKLEINSTHMLIIKEVVKREINEKGRCDISEIGLPLLTAFMKQIA